MNYSNHGYIEALYTPSILMWRYKRHVYSVYFKDPRTPGLLVTPVSIWHDPFTSTFEVRLAYIWDMHLRLEWYASNIVYLCNYKCDYIYIYIYIYIIIYICNHSIPSPKWVNDHPTNGTPNICGSPCGPAPHSAPATQAGTWQGMLSWHGNSWLIQHLFNIKAVGFVQLEI